MPAILACLIVDGVDQTVFQQFTTLNLDWYQSYDKALDIYYLVIAYLSTLRNWRNLWAFKISRFLLYYRLVGRGPVRAADARAAAAGFPEHVRVLLHLLRGRAHPVEPAPLSRTGCGRIAAAAIWIFIKLPQECWIHIAQARHDGPDQDGAVWRQHGCRPSPRRIANRPWMVALIAGRSLCSALVVWFLVIPRLPPPHHGWHFAADPLPRRADTPAEKRELVVRTRRPFDRVLLEKIVLVTLVSLIFAQILAGSSGADLQRFPRRHDHRDAQLDHQLLVCPQGIRLAVGRDGSSWCCWRSIGLSRPSGTCLLRQPVLGSGGGGFLLLLLTLLVTLYDYFRPMFTARFELRGRARRLAAT